MVWKIFDNLVGCIQTKPESSRNGRRDIFKQRHEYGPGSNSARNLYEEEGGDKEESERERPKEGDQYESINKHLHDLQSETETETIATAPGTKATATATATATVLDQSPDGWPTWLTKIAGDALDGWTPRSAESYDKLDKIGQGTYSNVYKARDRETGRIVALKKVRFDTSEQESVRFMAREIKILRRLDHPNIVKLEGLAKSRMQYSLYLVFEYMESDLASIISRADVKLTEAQVKCYMQQLLQGLEHCHERGVLHRDIKGSNLLVDKHGVLKIADFGLGTFFRPHQKQPLTNRVITLWYRPPELLLGVTEYGVAIDLWSAGCLLGELFRGKPIMPGRTEVEQLHKIFKMCGSPSEDYWKKLKSPNTAAMFRPQHCYKRNLGESFKDLPASALNLLNTLLALDPPDRGTASRALMTQFFTTSPLPCDPSCLPRFPQVRDLDTIIPPEGRRHRSGKTRTHKHRNTRNKKDHNIIKDGQEEMMTSIEEKYQTTSSELDSNRYSFHELNSSSSSGYNMNMDINKNQQNEGDDLSPISPPKDYSKKRSPNLDRHPKFIPPPPSSRFTSLKGKSLSASNFSLIRNQQQLSTNLAAVCDDSSNENISK
ncbi:hypothetical protein SUGI_0515410 [Cryptomeria japonica]|uniref:probable serine/threonine-protein kinase At1g54610 isoform X1 n=1 Tax=Cryptomeria japonica TaxID=3369 RepID=UPI00240893A2|nr:probable serine/threonine-protein kinase At1g54610 isoform X1 [Cryptomeria japonica]GLJ26581.1 hypothetical protein SUGI_0515410 [Cryptomeria japonica]